MWASFTASVRSVQMPHNSIEINVIYCSPLPLRMTYDCTDCNIYPRRGDGFSSAWASHEGQCELFSVAPHPHLWTSVGWSEGSCVERRGTRARPGSRNFLGCNEVISRKLHWDMQMYLPWACVCVLLFIMSAISYITCICLEYDKVILQSTWCLLKPRIICILLKKPVQIVVFYCI